MRKKPKVPVRRENSTNYKRKCVENNSSCYSNSNDEESHKHKNGDNHEEPKILNGVSQVDEEMVDASFVSQTDNDRKSVTDNDYDSYSQTPGDGRKGDPRKRKTFKKSKSKTEKSMKFIKKSINEHHYSSFKRDSESIEQFTMIRSMQIAREREDIVESRSLGLKVSLFCGLTQPQIQERILQDIESISNAITCNDKSESDVYSNSPQKDSEKDNRS